MAMRRVPVYLHASDPISYAGVAGQLRPRPEIRLLGSDETNQADVGLAVVDGVDNEALRVLRELRCAGVPRLVMVATRIDEADLGPIVEVGVSGLIRRGDATPDRLVTVITSAVQGEGSVPPDLLGHLLSQVGRLQRQVLGPRGWTFSGLTEREIDVLRLVADGFDTAEIALKLSYSERTVKNVLHDVTARLHLRNRTHAVAYALRHGLI
ncbi:response regulator transcription factor [Couchioplanes azureus]|uniref:response regulator transcription factor n=1 Tax=Couchioplanes caeruleus TaxID=56438 RepID=UPI00198418DF|nr:response regulator transcription factor [Couchioplanes caeruleus]GGQ82578.1 helix-turn-helix transcriptional regulator [Couchioplanes caeruleus subsp. azureus]